MPSQMLLVSNTSLAISAYLVNTNSSLKTQLRDHFSRKPSLAPYPCLSVFSFFSLYSSVLLPSQPITIVFPSLFYEHLFGFIEQFMNQAASHLANKEVLQGAVRNGRLLQAEKGWGKEVISKIKEMIVSSKDVFWGEGNGRDYQQKIHPNL